MKKYNHAFTIAFEVETDASCEIDEDYPTDEEILDALARRVLSFKENRQELYEAIGAPYDTYENY